GNVCDPDDDNDGRPDPTDNCPLIDNYDQADNDGDGQGDVCDTDDDNDGILDGSDNCPFTSNSAQADNDNDGLGDACDDDDDNDTVLDVNDNCPWISNSGQANNDGDSLGDACDPDDDNDTVPDATDNCPLTANADQADADGDGIGDVCDDATDTDGDGVLDVQDNCPLIANADQGDFDNDGIGDACDADCDGDGWVELCPTDENRDCDGDGSDDTSATLNPYCGAGADTVDFDGDGFTRAEGDCLEGEASVYPGAPELCGDLVDNNCDGNVNEGCDGGDELCGDMIDNDGDGRTDEGCIDVRGRTVSGMSGAKGGRFPDGLGDGYDNDGDGQCAGLDSDNDGLVDSCEDGSVPGDCDDNPSDANWSLCWETSSSSFFVVTATSECLGETLVAMTDGSFLNNTFMSDTGGDGFDNDCNGSVDGTDGIASPCTFVTLDANTDLVYIQCSWFDQLPAYTPQP
ncbi:MAG: cartilage oligomeric matrix protein, partial [Candidatus Magasanikbacteria bacterium]|nr:cartilage oligomeric matrix protein [Candidatus Magasanikbacteria bacterium]